MSGKLTASNRLILAILVIVALAVAFWILLLSPKRDEVAKLETESNAVQASLRTHRAEIAKALAARRNFPVDYQQLVVLGKAVPGDDETSSLFLQVNRIADRSKVRFATLELTPAEGAEVPAEAPPAEEAGPGGEEPVPASPTEVAAATMPLGASVGPAGLAVMPYSLTFKGTFFTLADFIKGLDSMVKTNNEKVAVDGRLVTIDGFTLTADKAVGFPRLEANFSVTTYLTPPDQGVTAGASPTGPETAPSQLASSTTGGAE
jgi:Tfp pilus assembly protein PilO